MTTKKSDDDNFFDDDLFDSDLFDDDDDESVTVQGGSSKKSSGQSSSPEDDEDLFDSLLGDQVDLPPRNPPVNKQAALSDFEEDHTEVIMDDYEELPNTYLTDEKGKVFNIKRTPFLIGRSKECDLVLNMKGVSRKHAEVTFGGGHFVIRDLDSLNGTRVNGVPVPQTRLNDADVLQLGKQKFNFFTEGMQAYAQRPAPPRVSAKPLPSARPSVQMDPSRLQQVQPQNGSNGLMKMNMVFVGVLVVIALGYAIWEDMNPSTSGDEMFAAGQQLDAQLKLPPLGDGEFLKVDKDDWTKTGELPPGEEDLAQLTQAVKAQMNGENIDLEPLGGQKEKVDLGVEEDVAAIRKQKQAEEERRAAEEAQAKELAIEERSANENAEARNLLEIMLVSYVSGNQFSNNVTRLDELSESSLLNNRTKRDLRNMYQFYSGLRSDYLQGQNLFDRGDHDGAFRVWQSLLVQEKTVVGDQKSYYARQIGERAIDMTEVKAREAEQAGNIGEALKLYRKLSELRPQGPFKSKIDQLMASAEERFSKAENIIARDPAKAVELLQSVMDATPRDHPLHIRAEAKLVWLKEGL